MPDEPLKRKVSAKKTRSVSNNKPPVNPKQKFKRGRTNEMSEKLSNYKAFLNRESPSNSTYSSVTVPTWIAPSREKSDNGIKTADWS